MKSAFIVIASAALLAAPARAVTAEEVIGTADVFTGIGVGNFSGDLGSLTSGGLTWTARVGINPWPYFGAELNYQGMHTDVGAIVPAVGAPLTGEAIYQQQISIDAKGGYPVTVANLIFKPYVLAGVGYAHVTSTSTLASVGLQSSDACAFPLGAGVEYHFTNIWALDTRFTYNILTGQRTTVAPSGDAWNVGVNVGARFDITGA